MSAIRALSPVKQLTVPQKVFSDFKKYLKVKHLINVAIFYLIVVFLYGLIGVYVIGPLNMKCIRTSYVEGMNISSDSCIMAEPKDLQSVISVPDYNCNPKSERSLCPANMTCRCVYLERNQLLQADFPNLGKEYILSTLPSIHTCRLIKIKKKTNIPRVTDEGWNSKKQLSRLFSFDFSSFPLGQRIEVKVEKYYILIQSSH